MSSRNELLQQLVEATVAHTEATKATRASNFALLSTLKKIQGPQKAKLRELRAPTPRARECSGCGRELGNLEDELHHVHECAPGVLEADHCPCAGCVALIIEDCGCRYCRPDRDELFGIPDEEVGTAGKLGLVDQSP